MAGRRRKKKGILVHPSIHPSIHPYIDTRIHTSAQPQPDRPNGITYGKSIAAHDHGYGRSPPSSIQSQFHKSWLCRTEHKFIKLFLHDVRSAELGPGVAGTVFSWRDAPNTRRRRQTARSRNGQHFGWHTNFPENQHEKDSPDRKVPPEASVPLCAPQRLSQPPHEHTNTHTPLGFFSRTKNLLEADTPIRVVTAPGTDRTATATAPSRFTYTHTSLT